MRFADLDAAQRRLVEQLLETNEQDWHHPIHRLLYNGRPQLQPHCGGMPEGAVDVTRQ